MRIAILFSTLLMPYAGWAENLHTTIEGKFTVVSWACLDSHDRQGAVATILVRDEAVEFRVADINMVMKIGVELVHQSSGLSTRQGVVLDNGFVYLDTVRDGAAIVSDTSYEIYRDGPGVRVVRMVRENKHLIVNTACDLSPQAITATGSLY